MSDTPTPFPPAGPQHGAVEAFDSQQCLGTIVDASARRWAFQCTALVDGSREIEVGTAVSFVIARRHGGRLEADRIAQLPNSNEQLVDAAEDARDRRELHLARIEDDFVPWDEVTG